MTNFQPDFTKMVASSRREDKIYNQFIEIEDNEALTRSAEGDSELFLLSCAKIKNIVNHIYDLKSQKIVQSSDQLREKVVEATSHVVTLKSLNRLEKLRKVSYKKDCMVEREKTDGINWRYQNLLYKHAHVKSECKKILLSLPQGGQSLNQGPFDLVSLELELAQQKDMAEQCDKLEKEKREIKAEIRKFQSSLDELNPKLKAVLECTKPLQEYFAFSAEETQSAFLLPDPLYFFFKNVDSYRRVYDNTIELEICGNVNDAKRCKSVRSELCNIPIKTEENRRKLVETHPLSVSCIIALNNGPTLKIIFHYCTVLNIVTVIPKILSFGGEEQYLGKEILDDEKILEDLFPLDSGVQSPNPDNEYQLENLGIGTFYPLTKEVGFPYLWAQRVCGMGFLPFENLEARTRSSCTNIETVMKTIVRRLRFRSSLAAQLQELNQNLLRKTPDTIDVPRTVSSVLSKWFPITWEDYCQGGSTTSDLRLHGLVGPNDFFYSARIKRNNSAILHAFVAINGDYPIQSPLFSLIVKFNGEFYSGNCDGVRDMERAINIMTDPTNPRWLLSIQLHHLCAYFDVFLETTFTSSFTQRMVFFKNMRGRNRKLPFNFKNIGTGLFTHYRSLQSF